MSSIYRAANAVRVHVTNEVLRPADITWTGFVVMWVVWICGRARDPAGGRGRGHLEGHADRRREDARGARAGWRSVGREDDRRLVELYLTPSGKALMEDLYPKFNAIESRVVRGHLRQHGRRTMTKSLRAIVTSIEHPATTISRRTT